MDRPFPALVALAAVLIFVVVWLATSGARHPDVKPPSRSAVSTDGAARDALPAAAANLGVRPNGPRPCSCDAAARSGWIPSLSEDTRSALVELSFGNEEDVPAADRMPAPDVAAPGILPSSNAVPVPCERVYEPVRSNRIHAVSSDAASSNEVTPDAVSSHTAPSDEIASDVERKKPDESGYYEREDEQAELLLMPTHDPRCRTEELERMARDADAHARHGFELAGRKAYFSARDEFVMALRLLAQGLDAQYHTKAHGRTLAAGLTALSEAEDFMPKGSDLEADLDLATIVKGHRTPVFHDVPCSQLTAMDASESYLTFAQQQLGFAAGGEVAGSMALYGLGKLYKTMAEQGMAGVRVARPKAVVFYQASLMVSPRNYMASNDLGVLMARAGRYEDARAALEHSVSICGTLSAWQNLAVVYRELGRTDAARNATRLADAASRAQPAGPEATLGAVQWVDAATFARAAGQTSPGQAAPPVAQPELAPRNPAQSPAASEEGNTALAAQQSGPSPGPAVRPEPPRQAAGWQFWKMFDVRK